jgi:hypothetical protein
MLTPSLACLITLCTFFDHFPHSVVSIPTKSPSHPSIPSDSTPHSRTTHLHSAAVRVCSNTNMKGTWKRRCRLPGPISLVRAHACRSLAPHASTARIYSLLTCSRDNFTCMHSYTSLRCNFHTSRAYFRTRLCRGLSSIGSSMCAWR